MRLHGQEVVALDRTCFFFGGPNIPERGHDSAAASQCDMDWTTLCNGEQLAALICGEITVEGYNALKAFLFGATLPEVRNGHPYLRKWPDALIREKPYCH